MIESTCPVCQKVFSSYPSQHKVYCSRTCRAVIQSQEMKGKRPSSPKAQRPRHGQMVACAICGKEVYRCTSQLDVRFCSYACANVWQRRNRVTTTCEQCGKEMSFSPSRGAVARFCSKRCVGDAVKRPAGRMHNGRPVRLDNNGYVLVWEPEHPNTSQHGWQYEHRLVAEAVLGRCLNSDEHVHHCNGVKNDNRPENLQVMDALDHAALSSNDYHQSVRDALAELAAYRARFGPLNKEE